MKTYISAALVVIMTVVNAGSVLDISVSNKMTTDFLTGFEGGIFLK